MLFSEYRARMGKGRVLLRINDYKVLIYISKIVRIRLSGCLAKQRKNCPDCQDGMHIQRSDVKSVDAMLFA